MVVCTYARVIHGPSWGYRRRGTSRHHTEHVSGSQGLVDEFGVELPVGGRCRQYGELRYLVIPMRPAGTEGWSEERLAELVTRDSMIGTGLVTVQEASV